jgi:acyl carrier protein
MRTKGFAKLKRLHVSRANSKVGHNMNSAIETQEDVVRNFIRQNFVLGSDGEVDLGSDQSLLDLGLIDSSGVLELIDFLEETFSIRILDEETVPENLDTISRIVAFVGRKQAT